MSLTGNGWGFQVRVQAGASDPPTPGRSSQLRHIMLLLAVYTTRPSWLKAGAARRA